MGLSITRRYHFESAHFLPNVPEGHKCKRMHGHNYEMEVTVMGPVDRVGFIIDFWDLDKIVQPIIELVDHRVLNDAIMNPTAEHIAVWFLDKLPHPGIVNIRIYETKDCWCDATRPYAGPPISASTRR